jgi:DNA (cytosine-5)-methyltransferase 1
MTTSIQIQNGIVVSQKRVAIDLFAGGGGLSQGLKQAGFTVCAAVENEPHACATYLANHSETTLFQRDIKNISGDELLKSSPTGTIDLIAACPPCQGFSSLTAKYKKNDSRNELIFDFVRLVREIRPASLMMENVPGLAKGKGKQIFNAAMEEFRLLGYELNYDVLDVADYGVPQSRRRLVVLGGLKKQITIPNATHSKKPTEHLLSWTTVKNAIGDVANPITLKKAISLGGSAHQNWNVVRNLSEINKARLRAVRAGESRTKIPMELRPECHKKTEFGFTNVYGRMSWNSPSPTITGGCTTLSKGRFGHPSQLRTISVYEAALLQTFPPTYKFDTKLMDKVCNIIGNALPPLFAEKMAYKCLKAIEEEAL